MSTSIRESITLIEQFVLMENRMEFLRQKYVPLIANIGYFYVPDNFDIEYVEDENGEEVPSPDNTFDCILEFDPDPQKRYSTWLLELFVRRGEDLEDFYKAEEYLRIFDRVKQRMPVEHRDIMRFKSIRDLYKAIQPFEDTKSQGEINRDLDAAMHAEAEVLYNDDEFKIVVPKTQMASCYFGRNTQWCTAAETSYNAFQTYNEVGPLYILLDKKNNRRWQLHFEENQFMDEHDDPVDPAHFAQVQPKLSRIMAEIIGRSTVAWVDQRFPVIRRQNLLTIRESLDVGAKAVLTMQTMPSRPDVISSIENIDYRWVGDHKADIATALTSLKMTIPINENDNVLLPLGLYEAGGKWRASVEPVSINTTGDDGTWMEAWHGHRRIYLFSDEDNIPVWRVEVAPNDAVEIIDVNDHTKSQHALAHFLVNNLDNGVHFYDHNSPFSFTTELHPQWRTYVIRSLTHFLEGDPTDSMEEDDDDDWRSDDEDDRG